MKRISILGSTGSIGTNCLNVIESQQGEFQVNYLTNYKNIQLLFEQAEKFRPNAVAIFENDNVAEYLPRF
ncbi:1-deoxy-D-xylulose-5-phosphate reductoisomerase, partial [candidate division KSB1 bacterium]|nr:1-deoxy-D-xylulose-5-phosphate reductoisomerase [candidate division KSB1 bacterium]